ncbi:MAG: twin-arginine translocase subunit TatC [Anaerolineales bacterium]|nr:MAG: twin-arginine translocase subunit TatC [Anaerolineales bacterium]
MISFLKKIFWAVAFPFVLLYRILRAPFVLAKYVWGFLTTDSKEDTQKEFWDHIEDLRGHLLRIVLGIALMVGISFYFTVPLMEFLAQPVNGLPNLQAIEVTEEIGVFMRVALTSGIIIALPYIAFEIWLFAARGMTAREKKFSLLAIPAASLLFAVGVGFTYFTLIPAALPFLGGFTEIAQFWTAKEYFGFITGLMLWIGIFFEFPLVIFVLSYFGFVPPKILAQQWRLAIVIIAILAAAVTPTIDPVNMGLVMLPMVLLYFVSVGLSYVAAALRGNKEPDEESTPTQEKQAAR